MAFKVIQDDIIKMTTDAVVNTIKAKAEVGEATYTKWDSAATRYVIHTTVPVWKGGTDHETEALRSCFQNSLRLAEELQCKSIAFPMMCIGSHCIPQELALEVAVTEIKAFLKEHDDMMIYLAISDEEAYQTAKKYVESNF